MRVGILGGTFDPPHLGHIAVARAAIESLKLDEVLLLPVYRNPLKSSKNPTPAKMRMEMVRIAIENEPHLACSDIEIARGGPSYAVETLQELTYLHNDEYWFLLGSDAIKDIDKWKAPKNLIKMCRFGVALRSGGDRSQLLASLPEYAREAVDWIDMKPLDVSSSQIRIRIADRRPVAQWLRPEVQRYIEEHKLYRS